MPSVRMGRVPSSNGDLGMLKWLWTLAIGRNSESVIGCVLHNDEDFRGDGDGGFDRPAP